MVEELLTMFGGLILSLLVYYQVPYLDNIAVIIFWAFSALALIGFGIVFLFFDGVKEKTREQFKNKSKGVMVGSEALSIFAIYLLHLSGQEALVTTMIILKMIAYTFIYFVFKEEPK